MIMKIRKPIPIGVLAVLMMPAFAQPERDTGQAAVAKGDFFIVSSIDLARKQILLKRPTEVTELMRVDDSTRYLEEHGKAIRLIDLRAGDTVYIVSRLNAEHAVAITIQKGPMTVEKLHERFLKAGRQP